jgi:threonine/homoserine/homoserine lactone efflux protein
VKKVEALFTGQVLLAYSIYFLGVASPGPSNLAIMGTAMASGRKPALVLSLGIIVGSCFWGVLAAFGLSAVLVHYSSLLFAMKIAAGIYLFWLALRSVRSVISLLPKKLLPTQRPKNKIVSHQSKKSVIDSLSVVDSKEIFFRGLLLHLTNPKAIFVWLSIVTFAMESDAHSQTAFAVVLGCGLIGICVFFTYALLFSTAIAQRIYSKMRIGFESLLAVFFSYAAFRMFTSHVKEV